MPATALQHFEEDIARARAIHAHADPLPHTNAAEQLLRSDLLRSSWMFAVGAMDAYFCDAYTDVVAAMAISKSRQAAITLPEWAYDIKIPIRAVLEHYDYTNWRWRMAARKMMERENVISLVAIQKLFNKFFSPWSQIHRRSLRRMHCAGGFQDQAVRRIARRLYDHESWRQEQCEESCDRPVRGKVQVDLSETARLHPQL
ncbi:hypothetical protein V5E97_11645 [Singulisphaera sp. Ch08]|uniref:Uncharacterized protein n=1 Tax=Singulisphaera sp. Ch08 TaxID=3120278 RepID=A0AAU7CNS4_9BACT